MTALPQSGGFTMVDPTHVAEVGAAAAMVYGRILWRNAEGPWRASREQLAAEVGLTTGALRRAVDVLREREWITTTRSSSKDATLVWAPVLPGHAEVADPAGAPCSNGSTPPAGLAICSYETGTDVLDTPLPPADAEQLPLVVAAPRALVAVPDAEPAVDPIEAEFAEFWQRYPRKVGKKPALAAWRRARKAAPLEVIAQGLLAQLPDLQRREPSRVPHAATWLNQERWTDDATHARQADVSTGRRTNHLLDLDGRGAEALDAMLTEQPFPARRALGGAR